ncbi:hypothetical protein XA68_10714 [Ophiocordyceps unilateralis]|uniref:Reverse transcriptase n=1 Tax=Ophiocordyceps unilateralis TaxID=268505 RepID=A0A2A9PQF8_OPHUN|nr:hypothetical protein XA68_10714 [Ophiocordyceps unilateralis]
MPIDFKPGTDVNDLLQRPYNLSPRDKTAMDSIIEPLRAQGIVEDVPLGEPCPAAAPAFIVWRQGKPRMVVDLRRTNTKLLHDAYPLPRQDEILKSLQGSEVFSVLDLTKGFFQQPIRRQDRWKQAFVTAHRGHERLTVSTMGLATSPAFFQHRMEHLLRRYLWQFVLVYIDDVIVYSRSTEDHLRHLDLVLAILANSGCTMSLQKCHFAHAGLTALGHFVSRLGLSTAEEKTEAIRALAMPTNLKDLESGLGLMGYYRQFVSHYAAIAEPLIRLKTIGFKAAPKKNPARDRWAATVRLPPLETPKPDAVDPLTEQARVSQENLTRQHIWQDAQKAWDTLKDKLVNAVDLAFPDFDRPFELHTDGSKQRGFGAALHQEQADGSMRPVVFLSKTLSPAERNYWATELETAALIWALHKLSQYLDHAQLTVVTDHTAIRDTFQGLGSGRPKGNYRLTNWKLQLDKWRDRITIKYREGSKHLNADALSRLPRLDDPDPYGTCQSPEFKPSAQSDDTDHQNPALEQQLTRVYPVFRDEDVVILFPVQTRRAAARLRQHTTVEPPPASQEHTPRDPSSQLTNQPRTIPATPTPPACSRDTANETITSATQSDSSGHVPLTPPHDNPMPDTATPQAAEHIASAEGHLTQTIHLSDDFRLRIAALLEADPTFRTIYKRILKRQRDGLADSSLNGFSIHLPSKLLFFDDGTNVRLCVPRAMISEVCRLAHDSRAHTGVTRSYHFLRRTLFFHDMKRQLGAYIAACAECQKSHPRRGKVYGDLQPVLTPQQPLATLCLDFIVGLPISPQGNDAALIITDKFSKFVRYIVGKTTWSSEDWAHAYIALIYPDWGWPDTFVHDVDPKLVSALWTSLCKASDIAVRTSAAYHQQANGQSERTIQIVLHGLRALLGHLFNAEDWQPRLAHVVHCMNTSRHTSTQDTPYFLLYGRHPRSFIDLDVPQDLDDRVQHMQQARQAAWDAIQIAVARMKAYYDERHETPPDIQPGDFAYVKLAKLGDDGYHLDSQTKLAHRRAGPFRILERISPLRFRLELPSHLRWKPEFSIEYLEPVPPSTREPLPPGPLRIDEIDKFIIDRILATRTRQGRREFRVSWMGYPEADATWEPEDTLARDVPRLLHQFLTTHNRKGGGGHDKNPLDNP